MLSKPALLHVSSLDCSAVHVTEGNKSNKEDADKDTNDDTDGNIGILEGCIAALESDYGLSRQDPSEIINGRRETKGETVPPIRDGGTGEGQTIGWYIHVHLGWWRCYNMRCFVSCFGFKEVRTGGIVLMGRDNEDEEEIIRHCRRSRLQEGRVRAVASRLSRSFSEHSRDKTGDCRVM
jgi:hypothetical protein